MISRRCALTRIAGGVALGAILPVQHLKSAAPSPSYKIKNKRVRQSVVHWCFRPMPVEELAENAQAMGMESVELVAPEHWPMLKKRGLICAITPSHGFAKGFARLEEHKECLEILGRRIDETAEAGFPSVITFSGFRRGASDEAGINNMVAGLQQIVGQAERKRVTLCLEMLNSRVAIEMKGHPDYFCDKLEIAMEVCRRISSERLKILFDIYHVQIMHGDLISRIRECQSFVGHYHTAGVPGRGEIDTSQEINYPAVIKAIVETGYKGFVGQEFIPAREKVASLSQAVEICDV